MHTIILIIGMGIFAVVAYGDVRRRLIPNELAIAIAILGLARMIGAGDPSAALYTVAAGAVVFVVGFLLFWGGVFGGGDVKLLSATVLLVGYRELFDFLMIMGLCGALLAVGVLVQGKIGRWLEQIPLLMRLCGIPLRLSALAEGQLDQWLRHIRRSPTTSVGGDEREEAPARLGVPYGVAIAAAGVLILVLQSSVPG